MKVGISLNVYNIDVGIILVGYRVLYNTNELFTWVCWPSTLKTGPIYIDCAIVKWLQLRTGWDQAL